MSSIYHYLGELSGATSLATCYTDLFSVTIQLENHHGNCTVANWVRSSATVGDLLNQILLNTELYERGPPVLSCKLGLSAAYTFRAVRLR